MDPLLVIGGWPLPETATDQYSCWEDMLSVQVDMISGRRVIEQRGLVWKVSATYDYLEDSALKPVLAVLHSGAPFLATVLPNNSEQTITTNFVVESLTPPKLLAFDGSTPVWHGLAFTLREERPHN